MVNKNKTKPVNRTTPDVQQREQQVDTPPAQPRTVNQEFADMKTKLDLEKKMRILTPVGFNNRYEEIQQTHSLLKAEAIYEMVEQEHISISPTKKRKYSSFDSFRQIRKRIIRGEME